VRFEAGEEDLRKKSGKNSSNKRVKDVE